MGKKSSLKGVFGAASGKDNEKLAMMMMMASAVQANQIAAAGEKQAAVAKEAAAAQTKQLQDQQVASNMALQQSMNQRTLAAQMEADKPTPEREAEIDLAPEVSVGASDPRRKFQSNRSSGVGIKIA